MIWSHNQTCWNDEKTESESDDGFRYFTDHGKDCIPLLYKSRPDATSVCGWYGVLNGWEKSNTKLFPLMHIMGYREITASEARRLFPKAFE